MTTHDIANLHRHKRRVDHPLMVEVTGRPAGRRGPLAATPTGSASERSGDGVPSLDNRPDTGMDLIALDDPRPVDPAPPSSPGLIVRHGGRWTLSAWALGIALVVQVMFGVLAAGDLPRLHLVACWAIATACSAVLIAAEQVQLRDGRR